MKKVIKIGKGKKKSKNIHEEIMDEASDAIHNIVNTITESKEKLSAALGVFDHYGDTHKFNDADALMDRLTDLEKEADSILGDWQTISDPTVPDKEDYMGI